MFRSCAIAGPFSGSPPERVADLPESARGRAGGAKKRAQETTQKRADKKLQRAQDLLKKARAVKLGQEKSIAKISGGRNAAVLLPIGNCLARIRTDFAISALGIVTKGGQT